MNAHADLCTPIGELARADSALLPIFERFGLDYCCRGRDTLAEACLRAGVDLARVLDAIAEEPRPEHVPPHNSMTELCDQIEATHHAFARQCFDRLDHLIPKIAEVHGPSSPGLTELSLVYADLREEMLDHMVREERVLFPWLRRLEAPHRLESGPPWSVRRPIDCMIHDHDRVAAAFARIRDLTSPERLPGNACLSLTSAVNTLRELERDTHLHIHKENNILFPKGVAAEEAKMASRSKSQPR